MSSLLGKDQCTGRIQRLPEHESLFRWLYGLVVASWGEIQLKTGGCLPPCTIISAHSKYLQTGTGWKHNYIGLYFEEKVDVAHIVLVYGLGALLVEIGSCLGLWLGLSVVGVFDIIVIAIQKTQKKFSRC